MRRQTLVWIGIGLALIAVVVVIIVLLRRQRSSGAPRVSSAGMPKGSTAPTVNLDNVEEFLSMYQPGDRVFMRWWRQKAQKAKAFAQGIQRGKKAYERFVDLIYREGAKAHKKDGVMEWWVIKAWLSGDVDSVEQGIARATLWEISPEGSNPSALCKEEALKIAKAAGLSESLVEQWYETNPCQS